MRYGENREARGKIQTWGRFNRGSDAECVMMRGITAEDVPIPVGLWQVVSVGLQQAVVLQTRKMLSLLVSNMLRISFVFCSSHLGTNDRILMFVRWAETRFLNGIVCGSCSYLQYGQVLGDYINYVVSTQLLFCLYMNVVVIELFAIHCTCYISCVVQLLPIMPTMLWH